MRWLTCFSRASNPTGIDGPVCKKVLLAGTTPYVKVPVVRTDTETGLRDTTDSGGEPDRLYMLVDRDYGPALVRLVRGNESDPHRRLDLLQIVHLEVWRSLATFDARCSLRTWVYRVAHNTALEHIARAHRQRIATLVSLDDIVALSDDRDTEAQVDHERARDPLQDTRRRRGSPSLSAAFAAAQLGAPTRCLS